MTINVFGGGDSSGPVFPLQRSVRLRSSASAYFNRTLTTPTNNLKWTLSLWAKRGSLGSVQQLLGVGTLLTGADQAGIQFLSGDTIAFYQTQTSTGTYEFVKITTQVFRDPSSWYHVVAVFDSANATASDRVQLYVNGSRITAFSSSTDATLNLASRVNSARAHSIGRYDGNINYLDGYLTEVNFVDGQALTPSSFGSINSTTGVWQPIKYSGTYGTNGFYLNFNDNSAATAAAIGKDSSGNGNNWTPNNISVTAGVTYDSMLDVPTLTSATNANFAVINPINSTATISNANLTVSKATSGQTVNIATQSIRVPTYFEASIGTFTGTNNVYFGVGSRDSANNYSSYLGFNSFAWSIGVLTGTTIYPTNNNVQTTITTTSNISTDVWMVAVNPTTGKIWWGKNGTWFASGNPSTDSNPMFSGLPSELFSIFDVNGSSGNQTVNVNFGQRPFTYTPPSGFKSLNTYNLPAPTIPNGATQFAATTYTGVGSSLAISNTVNGKSFQPDLVWVKGRSGATDHALYDSVRGTTKQLESNTTTAETTEATGLTAFDTGGFTVGALAQMNTNTATYVGWQWKASNAAPVTNTSGTITSSVSANPSAGFSIVTWTGTGANATVGHGLGVAPKMVIVKNRTGAANSNWCVWHTALAGTEYLFLQSTAAKATLATMWNSTTPTSSVFNLGTYVDTNFSTGTFVAYCFSEIAGYSKFGSYTGNGSTDGPFVYLGFRPRWLLLKLSSNIDAWLVIDSSRQTYNVMGPYLSPNSSAAEATTSFIDFTANGFKIRGTGSSYNTSSGTIIYAAFAESPFSYSLAR